MMQTVDRENITRLLKRLGRDSSTESFILFLAGNKGMIQSCRAVLAIERAGRQEAMAWLKQQCAEKEVPYHRFLQEVRKIAQIFQSDAGVDENYTALGLSPDATEEEVKRAYRRLSIQFHPDTAETSNEETTAAFIGVSRAYHAIIAGVGPAADDFKPAATPAGPLPAWNYQEREKTFAFRFSLKTALCLALLAGALVVFCLAVSEVYSRWVMFATLHAIGAVFVPPAGKGLSETSRPPMTFAEKLRRAKEADAVVAKRKVKGKDIAAAALPLEGSHAPKAIPASAGHAKTVAVRQQKTQAAEAKPSLPAEDIAKNDGKKTEQPAPHAAAVSKSDPARGEKAQAAGPLNHSADRLEKIDFLENKRKEAGQKAEPVNAQPERHAVLVKNSNQEPAHNTAN